MGEVQIIDAEEVLLLWEEIHGQRLTQKWRTDFLHHPALSEIQTHEREHITIAFSRKYIKLNEVLEYLRANRPQEDLAGRGAPRGPHPVPAKKVAGVKKVEPRIPSKLYVLGASPRDTPGFSMQGTEAPNRSDRRPNNRKEVLLLMCSIRDADVERDSQLLKHWGQDSAIAGLVKYREDLIRQIAANHHTALPRELPALIARELREGAKAAGRDSSSTLQGRDSRKTGGANPRPADSTLHKQIGSTQKDQ